jgi:two-component system phosphate regulon response regulator PhoB
MANARLLLVEDDRALADLVTFHFERSGYDVTRTGDGEEALILADEMKPDVILLDWMIEGISGIEVCRRLRRRATTANVPIMMLTARGEESDRIRGFETGADDYVTKPFSPRELVARVQALLRRARPERGPAVLEVSGLRIDPGAREASFQGTPLALTPREFELLAFFAQRPGRVLTREELLRKLWGYDYLGETRTVDVHIRRIRSKIGEQHRLIETVPGVGYKLIARSPAA